MRCFSDFQEIFNPFGVSFITILGCVLCTAKLKQFIPVLCDSSPQFLLVLLPKAGKYTEKGYLGLVTSGCHTLFLFHTNIYTHTYPSGLNPWHVMHKNINPYAEKSALLKFICKEGRT